MLLLVVVVVSSPLLLPPVVVAPVVMARALTPVVIRYLIYVLKKGVQEEGRVRHYSTNPTPPTHNAKRTLRHTHVSER